MPLAATWQNVSSPNGWNKDEISIRIKDFLYLLHLHTNKASLAQHSACHIVVKGPENLVGKEIDSLNSTCSTWKSFCRSIVMEKTLPGIQVLQIASPFLLKEKNGHANLISYLSFLPLFASSSNS